MFAVHDSLLWSFILVSLAVYVLYRTCKTPLYPIPGPWYSHFTHYVLKIQTLRGRRMHYVHSLHKYYGPIIRISPRQVAIADAEGFRTIHRMGSAFAKTKWYADFSAGIGIGIFAMRDRQQHAIRRKLFARAFSQASLRRNCEQVVRAKVDMAVQRIHDEVSVGTCDVMKWWMLMASDVVGELSFGESFGLIESGEKSDYIHALESLALWTTLQYELPWVFSVCSLIPIRAAQTFVNATELVNAYASRAVTNLHRNRDNPANLFATMLSASEDAGIDSKEKSHMPSDESIRIEASNFILAGTDTTANTLTYVIWCILSRPSLQARLQDEIESVGEFDDAVLEKLPLLNAVIEETLRLFGAVPGNLSRVVPPAGMETNGYYIPGGFEVETQAFTLHRDEENFPNALEFDENRWLATGSISSAQKAPFCPFGAGSRSCVGIHLARMELRLATVVLMKKCPTLKLAEGMSPSMMEMFDYFIAGPVGHRCDVTI